MVLNVDSQKVICRHLWSHVDLEESIKKSTSTQAIVSKRASDHHLYTSVASLEHFIIQVLVSLDTYRLSPLIFV